MTSQNPHLSAASPTPKTLRNDIQGLRALAVLAVVAFHADSAWLPGGYVGVDVFFVISGFLITSIILRQREDARFSFIAFYLARLRRIVPAYMAMIGLTSLVMAALLVPRDFDAFKASAVAAIYFGSNVYFAEQNDYFAAASHELPLLHTWSLAIEMQFYLILPFLLVFVPKRVLPALLLIIAFVLVAVSTYWLTEGQQQAVYFSLLARVPEFLIGSLATFVPVVLHSKRLRNALAMTGLCMMFASFLLVSETTLFPGLMALPVCIGTTLVIVARDSPISRVLSSRPMVWCGNLSYSIYLWHWPVLACARYVLEDYNLPAPVLLVALGITLALSYLSWRCIEVPFRRARVMKDAIARDVGLTSAIILMLLGAVRLETKLADPLPLELSRYAAADEICHGEILADCLRGNPASDVAVLLIGDSHAAQLNLFADAVGERLGVRFEVVTASGCVPINGFDILRIPEFAHAACAMQIEEINRRMVQADAVVMAGKWVYHMPSEAFIDAMASFFATLQEQKKPLLVLAQIPMMDGDIRRARRFARLGLPHELMRGDDWQKSNKELAVLTDSYDTATFLDLSGVDLFQNAPFYEGVVIYFDRHHINEIGSNLYGQAAAAALANWLKDVKLLP